MCAEVDWTVGEVLQTLDRLGLADTTLVIFTSDNGGIVGDRREGVSDIGPEDLYETYGHHVNGPFRGTEMDHPRRRFSRSFRSALAWPDHEGEGQP